MAVFFRLRALLLAVLLALAAPGVSGCSAAPDPLARLRVPFTAKLAGERASLRWEAELTAEDGTVTLRYTSPQSLSGLTLIRRGGTLRAEAGEVCYETTAEALEGLWIAAEHLTGIADVSRWEHTGGGFSVLFADGSVLLLTGDGCPARLNCPEQTVLVTEFDPLT